MKKLFAFVFLLYSSVLFADDSFIQSPELDNLYSSLMKDISLLPECYNSNSIMFIDQDTVIRGKNAAGHLLSAVFHNKRSFTILSKFRIKSEQGIYEIITIKTKKGDIYSSAKSWGFRNKQPYIIWEFLSSGKNPLPIAGCIDEFRLEFTEIVNNEHNAVKLLDALYEPKAFYYNRGYYIQGLQKIAARYRYMNNPGYSISLAVDRCEPVSRDTVFEIGTWSSPGHSGKYVLVWKLQEDNTWKILLDSNY